MNKPIIKLSLLTASILVALPAVAAPVPSGFSEFYQVSTKEAKLRGFDGRLYSVVVDAGYDSLQLTADQVPQMRDVLLNMNIIPTTVETMLVDLQAGLNNQSSCEGNPSDCTVIPDTYEFYFDYFDNTVYVYINPNLLVKTAGFNSGEIVYAEPADQKFGIINHFDLYADADTDRNNSFSVNNESIINLPYGRITSDMHYQYDKESDDNNDVELDELLYHLERENYRVAAGLSRGAVVNNSTSFISGGMINKELAVTIGTSKNLALNFKRSLQKFYYFAPSDGVLKVYRDDRVVHQQNVQAGQGYITNEVLPQGQYTAIFEITSGNEVVSTEIQSVYNASKADLAVGDMDASVSAGTFQKTYDSFAYDEDGNITTEEMDSDLEEETFVRGLFAYRPFDEVTLGFGTIATERDLGYVVGLRLYLPFDAQLDVTGQAFAESGYYYSAQLNLYGFTAGYRAYEADEDAVLSEYYYGDRSYEQLTVSKGFAITDGVRGYANYSLYSAEASNDRDAYESSTLSLGASTYVYGDISLQFNVDYNFVTEEDEDEYKAQISLSIPLGETLSLESSLYTNETDVNYWRNTLRARDLLRDYDDVNLSASLNQYYTPNAADEEFSYSGSLSASYDHGKFLTSAYAYTDFEDSTSGAFNFSSSQLISGDGIAFTSERADSYLVVDAQGRLGTGVDETEPKGLLLLESDERNFAGQEYIYNDKEVIPLQPYDNYRAYVDTDSLDLSNEGETYATTYAMPGTIQYINTDITRVLSFVSGFKDLFENTIYGIRCIGDACITTDEVVGGIYKVSVKEGQAFRLATDELNCYIPPVDGSGLYNFGMNYCLPKVEPMEQFITRNGDRSITVTFVGGFELAEYNDLIRSRLMQIAQQNSDQEIIEKVIGDNIFVYVKFDQGTLTAQQRDALSELQQYVRMDILLDDARQYILVQDNVTTVTGTQG